MNKAANRSIRARLKEWAAAFEQFAVDIVYDRRHDWKARYFGYLLSAFSYLFRLIARSRYLAYHYRFFRDKPLGCLVIVVGNLTVGGTGKTPVVEKFARSLHERGRKVAILSRGYKSRKQPAYKKLWYWMMHKEPPKPRVVSDGETVYLNSMQAGDEPYMLARNLPGVIVITDKNRVKAGEYAIRHYGADTLILDDGFQYLPLRGGLNLLLVDKTNPFGNGYLLPRGILREPLKHLKRASYVFLTKSDGEPDPELEQKIRRYKPDADLIECSHKPRYLQPITANGSSVPLSWLKGKRIGALSGIAMPESFEKLLRETGASIVFAMRYLDHHRYTEQELKKFLRSAARLEVDAILTTEKDAVRLPEQLESTTPFYYLRVEVDILKGVEDFEEAVSRVCFPKQSMKATRPPVDEQADDASTPPPSSQSKVANS